MWWEFLQEKSLQLCKRAIFLAIFWLQEMVHNQQHMKLEAWDIRMFLGGVDKMVGSCESQWYWRERHTLDVSMCISVSTLQLWIYIYIIYICIYTYMYYILLYTFTFEENEVSICKRHGTSAMFVLKLFAMTSMVQDKVQSLQLSVEAKCCFLLPSDPGDNCEGSRWSNHGNPMNFWPTRSYPTKK